MSFSLTEDQEQEKKDLTISLDKAHEALAMVIHDANDVISNLLDKVNSAKEDYNEIIKNVNDFVIDIASDLTSEYLEMSDDWKESDRGNEVSEVIDAWNSFLIQPLEDFYIEELEISEDDEHIISEFEALGESA